MSSCCANEEEDLAERVFCVDVARLETVIATLEILFFFFHPTPATKEKKKSPTIKRSLLPPISRPSALDCPTLGSKAAAALKSPVRARWARKRSLNNFYGGNLF